MDDKKPLPGKGRGAKKRKPNVGKQASRLRNENPSPRIFQPGREHRVRLPEHTSEGWTLVSTKQARVVDWEAIERKYRAGLLSVREIAKQHDITHGAIQKRAKVCGWQRDLTAKVQQAVAAQLVATSVATDTAVARLTERQIVDESAAQIVALVREHRQDIKSQRSLMSKLLEQLDMTAEDRDEIERTIVSETSDADDPDASKADAARAWNRRTQMLKAISLPQNAATLKDLSTVLKTVIALEREAFNVSSVPDKTPEDDASVSRSAIDAMDARLDRLLGPAAGG